MENNQIILTLEGLPKHDGHVPFRQFVKSLDALRAAIKKCEAQHIGGESVLEQFRVIALSHNSPASMTLQGSTFVASAIGDALAAADDSERDLVPWGYSVLEDILELAKPAGKRLLNASLCVNDSTYALDREFAAKVELLLSRAETCIGTVRGRLEAINLHGAEQYFTIYPEIGASSLRCTFKDELLHDAINALEQGNDVEVTGLLHFRPNSRFPHEVHAEKLIIIPDDDSLPSFADLLGVAPEATGEKSSEDFIREKRNEWG